MGSRRPAGSPADTRHGRPLTSHAAHRKTCSRLARPQLRPRLIPVNLPSFPAHNSAAPGFRRAVQPNSRFRSALPTNRHLRHFSAPAAPSRSAARCDARCDVLARALRAASRMALIKRDHGPSAGRYAAPPALWRRGTRQCLSNHAPVYSQLARHPPLHSRSDSYSLVLLE